MKKKNLFTDEERSLISIYNPGTRAGLIAGIETIRKDLAPADRELAELTTSVLEKVKKMTDEQFREMNFRFWVEG